MTVKNHIEMRISSIKIHKIMFSISTVTININDLHNDASLK